ncbi:hypothetical protein GCM10027022_18060 [Alpinimonas psychrophila]|uniref:Putative membrane protein n=1 Tax=Alpinimonas psychrophila TaxID=748908 RepID=A0A7W3PPC8_9MICO|nr:DUF3566 domain-containing protein [Alpinimonas psychrophila]MBA8829335.1 putative membrane protein [Alpinimonas psychrophila]
MSNTLKRLSSKIPKPSKGPELKQVRLKLVYIDFLSALKLSFLLGLAQAIVVIVASFLLYMVFVQTGIFDRANTVAGQVLGGQQFNIKDVISVGSVLGFSTLVAGINLVIITVLGAVCAIIYNMSAKIVGGLSVGFTNQ